MPNKKWRVTAYIQIRGMLVRKYTFDFYELNYTAETFNMWRTGQFPRAAMLECLP